jgi:outer membrane lipoprotein-sorting protein
VRTGRVSVVGAVAALAALLAGAVPPGASGQEARALSILEAASARYASASTVCADFFQTLTVPLIHQESQGKGRMCQAQPDRFAMRFDDPDGDAVVMDGTFVWVYYKSQDPMTVLRFPVAQAPGGFDLYREFLEAPAQKYRMSYAGPERVNGRDTHRVLLVPIKSTSYTGAEVWIDQDDHLLRRVKIEEENESVRTVDLSDIALGAEVPQGWFTFTPPPGAHVIAR